MGSHSSYLNEINSLQERSSELDQLAENSVKTGGVEKQLRKKNRADNEIKELEDEVRGRRNDAKSTKPEEWDKKIKEYDEILNNTEHSLETAHITGPSGNLIFDENRFKEAYDTKINNKENRKKQLLEKEAYQGYTGSDIIACFRLPETINTDQPTKVFAELSTISYSTYRDKFPVRALGHIKTKGYTTGTRTVAGTLVFKVLDKTMINKIGNWGFKQSQNLLPDELPPFDINLTLSNEAGDSAMLEIIGVEITEGNQVMSAEQLSTDETYSFVAHDLRLVEISQNAREHTVDRLEDEISDLEEIRDSYDPEKAEEVLDELGMEFDKSQINEDEIIDLNEEEPVNIEQSTTEELMEERDIDEELKNMDDEFSNDSGWGIDTDEESDSIQGGYTYNF